MPSTTMLGAQLRSFHKCRQGQGGECSIDCAELRRSTWWFVLGAQRERPWQTGQGVPADGKKNLHFDRYPLVSFS